MASRWLFLAVLAYLVFVAGARNVHPPAIQPADVPGSVVLPAPLQTVVYLGDPYLAANVEATRVLMTGGPAEGVAQDYFDRLHLAVAVLNPCHEDNYYVANGLMAWAGSVDGANAVLQGATGCRFWDEIPPFFWGFNLNFFKRQHHRAKELMFTAADRATANRAAFQRIGLLFEAESYPDIRTAYEFLENQRKQVRDERLKQLLSLRIDRLAGLIALDGAQVEFERHSGRRLRNPQELLESGQLKEFPKDPTGLGYLFENGRFSLREVTIRGTEGVRR